MGYFMVTPNYHYVQWRIWDHIAGIVESNIAAEELYDLQSDPEEHQHRQLGRAPTADPGAIPPTRARLESSGAAPITRTDFDAVAQLAKMDRWRPRIHK